jgi:hypothetical protein
MVRGGVVTSSFFFFFSLDTYLNHWCCFLGLFTGGYSRDLLLHGAISSCWRKRRESPTGAWGENIG